MVLQTLYIMIVTCKKTCNYKCTFVTDWIRCWYLLIGGSQRRGELSDGRWHWNLLGERRHAGTTLDPPAHEERHSGQVRSCWATKLIKKTKQEMNANFSVLNVINCNSNPELCLIFLWVISWCQLRISTPVWDIFYYIILHFAFSRV